MSPLNEGLSTPESGEPFTFTVVQTSKNEKKRALEIA